MGKITLVTGGCRSGKSAYAQAVCERLEGPRAMIATAVAIDDEMHERIRKHREARDGALWETLEEPIDVVGALRSLESREVVLVDCLTVWIGNLLVQAEPSEMLSEEGIQLKCREILEACAARPGEVIFVTNEVGLSVVPGTPLGRRFRDLVGRCNQTLAAAADRVVLMTCGIPQVLKRGVDQDIAAQDEGLLEERWIAR